MLTQEVQDHPWDTWAYRACWEVFLALGWQLQMGSTQLHRRVATFSKETYRMPNIWDILILKIYSV